MLPLEVSKLWLGKRKACKVDGTLFSTLVKPETVKSEAYEMLRRQ